MTVSTLRPDGTSSSSGVTLTGAATLHAALSDNSDASYGAFGGTTPADDAVVTLGDFTLPAGGIVKSFALRIRTAYTPGGTNQLRALASVAGLQYGSVVGISWTSPTTITIGTFTGTWTEADFDAATIELTQAVLASLNILVYEAYLDVTYVTKPVVAVVAPPARVTDTNRPTVRWSDTLDSDGGTQAAFTVHVFNAAQYGARGFDPATSTPVASYDGTGDATSWQVSAILPDDTYRAYVRVGQLVNGAGLWSDYAYTQFALSVALPAVPTFTLTAQSASGRVKLVAVHNSGSATTDALEFEYSTDGGTTWAALRTADGDGLALSADATVYDWESGNGQTVSYRARALHNYSGVYAASAWATVSGAWTAAGVWWLKHPLRPDLSMIIVPRSLPSIDRAARQGVFQPLGASQPVVVTDTRASGSGSVVLRLDTDAERVTLDALLAQGGVMLLQGPSDAHWTDRYLALGDTNRARLVDAAWSEPTFDTFAWTETRRPAGALLSVPA